MDLRTEFMQRISRGERVTDLCREYGVSRKTGQKYKRRFERFGVRGLEDESRAPHVIPHKTPPEIEELVLAERRLHPTWGPKKLKETLERRLERRFPSVSTCGDILARHGVVLARRTRRRHAAMPTGLRKALAPNDVWCIDYKGQFRLGDASYCYPLTITDQFSRYILGCEGMSAISDDEARDICEEVFREYGVPSAMRSDNGAPFASTGLGGLTRLSVFWLRLGIALERIRPAHPEENGQHERMHRTLKFETAKPPRANLLLQQERFDAFVDEFNKQRPHEALGMKVPADVYKPSSRDFPDPLPALRYPDADDTLRVNSSGHVYVPGFRSVYLSLALRGELVGVRELRDGRWIVSYADRDLGYLDGRTVSAIPDASTPPEATTV